MKKLFSPMVIIALTISAFSQSPNKMTYQCVIRNASGVLMANQSVGIKISILQGSPTGTLVFQEIYNPNPQTNANGLLSIEIGGGIPLTGTFSTIDWSSGPYFLKTETDPTGATNYTIAGLSQLLSVPYALYAKNAASYNETDPVFGLSPAGGITSGNISDWSTAFGWGNHAGLYKFSSYIPAWSEITGKPTSIDGYGITDAVTISSNQTITGTKTISNDLLVNGLTVGKGKNALSGNTAIGNQALSANTTGNYNTASGTNALRNNTTGNYNTANGFDALIFNTEGNNNTANGNLSLYANTTGSGNTAGGSNSLSSNTAGNYNTATGTHALYRNTEGSENTANGYGALNSNTTGNYNTASGYVALYANTTGNDNSAYGHYSLYYNTAGNFNTAYGNNSLYFNTTGYSNTAVGYRALFLSSTGHRNTVVGDSALYSNTTGSGNTVSGYRAGFSNTTGNYNVFIGSSAGYFETGSNKLFIDNQSRANESDARVKALIYGIFDADPANQVLTINGIVNVNSNKIINVANPVNAQDAATKAYVDALQLQVSAMEDMLAAAGLLSIKDNDGNTYSTVKIGDQIWIVENLKTTKYNDGTPIPLVTDNSAWYNLLTPGYCWYNNDIANKATYGAMYNWYAVNTGKLCPTGWHVPTDAEWTTLIDYLGGTYPAGAKLKETGNTHWVNFNDDATNESGFTALPGGDRYGETSYPIYGGLFYNIGTHGSWWSATAHFPDKGGNLLVGSTSTASYANLGLMNRKFGYSVRCLKD